MIIISRKTIFKCAVLIGALNLLCLEETLAQKKSLLTSQIAKERKNQEKTLRSLSEQVKKYDQIITSKSSEEKVTLADIEVTSQQMAVQTKLIFEIQKAQEQTEQSIREEEINLKNQERELAQMKEKFARFAVGIYKYGSPNAMEVLLSSESIGKGVVRAKYVQVFQNIVKIRFKEILNKLNQIQSVKKNLEAQYAYNVKLISERKTQVDLLAEKRKKKEQNIKQLQADKKRYRELLQEKQRQIELLKSEIQKLIAKENEAIEAEKEKRSRKTSTKPLLSANKLPQTTRERPNATTLAKREYSDEDKAFLALKGKLPMPVRGGTIVKPFGENFIETSNIKTFNNGIDIATPVSVPVMSVYDGKVTIVTYLPTFGNIVTVRHANSFITVYANLEDIKVIKGAMIKKGAVIGSVAKSMSGGYVVHFEIWDGRQVNNPNEWL